MARIRSISPAFFKNEALGECSVEARLLFIASWCLADKDGRFEDRPKRIRVEAFPYDNVDVDKLLAELAG
ncbi:MAG: phage replication protein, partial [Coriobacteriia bacterium]